MLVLKIFFFWFSAGYSQSLADYFEQNPVAMALGCSLESQLAAKFPTRGDTVFYLILAPMDAPPATFRVLPIRDKAKKEEL